MCGKSTPPAMMVQDGEIDRRKRPPRPGCPTIPRPRQSWGNETPPLGPLRPGLLTGLTFASNFGMYHPSCFGGRARGRRKAASAFSPGLGYTCLHAYKRLRRRFQSLYGALKQTPYRWLDLRHLCTLLLPGHTIGRIRYFTAQVHERPDKPGTNVRQQVYLRALRTIPNLTIHLGFYQTHPVVMRDALPSGAAGKPVRVLKTEEKGSDLNLATYLLVDGFRGEYETAVVVSNDSDLCEPIRIVRHELNKAVGVLNPHPHPSRALLRHVTFLKQIRRGVLAQSQFPPTITDGRGTFHKPPVW